MTTRTCTKCNKAFTHTKEKSADFALAMHMSRIHNIRSAHADHVYKLRLARAKKKDIATPQVVSKRKYVRKPAAQESGPLVQFCPRCGCNLHAVSVAIRMQG
jgi:hypothetical protein